MAKRIMWHGVPAMFGTGYGVQTSLFTRKLAEMGHDVVISSVAGISVTYKDANGILTLSQGIRGSLGNDFIRSHIERFNPDLIISMSDTFTYDLKIWAEVVKSVDWYAWQVIDSEPLSPEITKRAMVADRLLAMAHFGEAQLKNAGFGHKTDYVPLAYSPDDYFMEDKTECRNWLFKTWNTDWRGKFVVMMNCANMSMPSRKNFACAFMAFKKMLYSCPNALLYVHTETTGIPCNGENLMEMAKACGLTSDNVVFPPQYEYNTGLLDPHFLRKCYNACDVLLYTSRGEGFGVPIIEAQACGVPVIVPDNTAMPELVKHGVVLDKRYQVPFMYVPYNTQYVINPSAVSDALVEAYKHPMPHEQVKVIEQYSIAEVYRNNLAPLIDGHTITKRKEATK